MIQDFNIKYIKESYESSDDLYNIIKKRVIYCKNFQISEINTGPPDLCYIVRENTTKSFLGFSKKHDGKYGSYHYVYGLDTSNTICIYKYILSYINTFNNQILQNNTSNKNKIETSQSIFCCFDIFYEKDLRILVKFPGGVKNIFYIDENQPYEANQEDLRTAFLSSMIRSWCFNDFLHQSNCVFLEEINTPELFEYLVDSITYIVTERAEYKYPNFEKKLNFVLTYFVKYLMSTRRFSFLVTYFSKLSYSDSALAKFVLKPLKFLKCYGDALQFIANLLLNTSSPMLICHEIELLTILNKFAPALELAKYVTSINPECAETWLSLANLYLNQKKYENCLKALNNIYYLNDILEKDLNAKKNIKNKKKDNKNNNSINIKEIPLQKLKLESGNNTHIITSNDILYFNKYEIDVYYNSNQFFLCENSEVLQDVINKILTSSYYNFNDILKKSYKIILTIIKEINFDTFIDLKNKLFVSKKKKKENDNNYNNTENNSFSNQNNTNNYDENYYNYNNNEKIPLNPHLEEIFSNLINDLKIFSITISQEENTYNYFQSIANKNELAIAEIKFCISFAIMSERLNYYHTALKYYLKALKYCFSKYIYIRVIKLNVKLKDFKSSIVYLGKFLNYTINEQLMACNKTPLWMDKIILKVLFEYQASEIIYWLNGTNKYILEFFKKIINKYKFWVEAGHELHLIK